MKVNFVVRKTKMNSGGYVPIEMTICVKGKRQYVSTGRSVMPSKFSPKTQTVKGDKELSEFLKAMKARVYSIETLLLTKGVNVTLDTILDVLRYGEEEKTVTFLQVFDIHTENIRKKVKQKLVTDTTLSKYKVTRGYLERYIKTELKKDDILMKDLSPSLTLQNNYDEVEKQRVNYRRIIKYHSLLLIVMSLLCQTKGNTDIDKLIKRNIMDFYSAMSKDLMKIPNDDNEIIDNEFEDETEGFDESESDDLWDAKEEFE